MDRIPCRVSQDLSRHHAALDRAELDQPEFDCFDKDQVEDIVGKTLAEPVQNLLVMEAEGLDSVSPRQWREAIAALREAMKTAYTDSL